MAARHQNRGKYWYQAPGRRLVRYGHKEDAVIHAVSDGAQYVFVGARRIVWSAPGAPPMRFCPRCRCFQPTADFWPRTVNRVREPHGLCKACQRLVGRDWHRRRSPAARLLASAKNNARKCDVPFNLELSDVLIPAFCPVLGIAIRTEFALSKDAAPSIDRIIPARGYMRGNVVVVSWRANRLKNDATADDLEKIAAFYVPLIRNA